MTDKYESDYVNYPLNTRVKVKETGEYGDAFESSFGYISVFLDSQDRAVLFKMEEVEFLEKLNQHFMTDKKTGIELIAEERKEQIEKHGFNKKHDSDKYHQSGELVEAAKFCEKCTGRGIGFDTGWPKGWNHYWRRSFLCKTKIQALIVAGAFYMAENDRIGSSKYDSDIHRVAAEIDRLQNLPNE